MQDHAGFWQNMELHQKGLGPLFACASSSRSRRQAHNTAWAVTLPIGQPKVKRNVISRSPAITLVESAALQLLLSFERGTLCRTHLVTSSACLTPHPALPAPPHSAVCTRPSAPSAEACRHGLLWGQDTSAASFPTKNSLTTKGLPAIRPKGHEAPRFTTPPERKQSSRSTD